MVIARRIGAIVLVFGAFVVWFGMAPSDDSSPDHSSDVAAIEAEDDGNNLRAEGAPQQAVVNGWTTIRYQQLLSEQMDEASSAEVGDDRPTAMIGLCVVGLALVAFTARDGGPSTQPGEA